jgi:hypothetical protein
MRDWKGFGSQGCIGYAVVAVDVVGLVVEDENHRNHYRRLSNDVN